MLVLPIKPVLEFATPWSFLLVYSPPGERYKTAALALLSFRIIGQEKSFKSDLRRSRFVCLLCRLRCGDCSTRPCLSIYGTLSLSIRHRRTMLYSNVRLCAAYRLLFVIPTPKASRHSSCMKVVTEGKIFDQTERESERDQLNRSSFSVSSLFRLINSNSLIPFDP